MFKPVCLWPRFMKKKKQLTGVQNKMILETKRVFFKYITILYSSTKIVTLIAAQKKKVQIYTPYTTSNFLRL